MAKKPSIFEKRFVLEAIGQSFVRLNPLTLWRNPVMLIVEMGALSTLIVTIMSAFSGKGFAFNLQITVWLIFTVLFSTFAESLAESRGKAQAETLRQNRSETKANRLINGNKTESVPAISLRKGDRVVSTDGEMVPSDGEIEEGVALLDESAITGESAPVVREAGGDRSGVTGGTKVLSGKIIIRITADPGETFIDQMISMVESASRQKTPNEIALEILLIALTCVFIAVTFTLSSFAIFMGLSISLPVLISLLVCLMPTTIGGLLPAIGIAGMDRLISKNVVALSGRAVEASGDVDIVLLDKTGTITLGNRHAQEFLPAPGVDKKELVKAAMLSSLSDETPEGRSILTLAKEVLGIRGKEMRTPEGACFIPFSAETRMSGIDVGLLKVRKGAIDAIETFVKENGGSIEAAVKKAVDSVAEEGGTPLAVASNDRVLGVIRLKDILKEDIKQRLSQLRSLGIRSVMITGDNPLTAASIAAEAGIDDFIAQARPETKLEAIRKAQAEGHLVAMIGDGTNDAPALAQADVGVAMNAGTQAAREAANMVDLDSNPSKLLDIVETGKQILITRGALTTFSIANDVAKYFAIIPALFAVHDPSLNVLNIMRLATPQSAVLSAVIFNALIIPLLIPLALKGVSYKPTSASSLLRWNLLVYGLGGLALPFIGIKLIDMLIVLLGLS